jgi:serine protease AprX
MTRLPRTHPRRSLRHGTSRRSSSGPRAVLAAAVAAVVLGAGAFAATAATASPAPKSTKKLATAPSTAAAPDYPQDDTGGPSGVTRIVGAQNAWAAGWTGRGVDVAVLDTGVTRVPGLDGAGKVIDGPDLSFDAPQAAMRGLDGYGHGTFMAGLVAGRDAGAGADATGCTTCLNASGFSDTTKYVGVAPEARIVNVKVGAADGAVDVSQVIAAIDWVVQHAHDPGMNIRVLSLSYGTDSNQLYQRDPLAQAAEQAWKHGIVVVAAAGNDGRGPGKVADPAYDPYLVAAGALDPMGTLSPADDVVPDFAQHGTEQRPVDVIAPASHVIGLRVPGSYIDVLPGNTGKVGTRFQRGSGTSEAAAVVAGAAALLAQKYPSATPDTIKGLLNGSARPLPHRSGTSQTTLLYSGHGTVDVGAALAATPSASTQNWTSSAGDQSLDKSRAGEYVSDGGRDLTGEKDIFGHAFDSAAMAQLQRGAAAWNGGVWNGNRWSGDGWEGNRWSSTTWTGTTWAGNRWSGNRWSGMAWDGNRWSGGSWSGGGWTGNRWSGNRWSTAAWG